MDLKSIREKIDYPKTAENLQFYFKKIEDHFENYEERNSQKEMIRAIVKSFKMGEHALIEAPTGTGKSLAYLLAFLSIWEQFENVYEDEKLVARKPKLCIATNTIALQEQLMYKDIPSFQDIIGVDFKTSLVKGRSNYVCKRELNKVVANPEEARFYSLEETQEFNNLVNEIIDKDGNIVKGDRSEVETKVSNSVWDKVTTDSGGCTGKKCPLYNECFFYEAKKENAQADVLLTNHAMFFADLKVKIDTDFEFDNLVLPPYDFVVFDEAHNLEDVASNFFGEQLSRNGIRRFCTEMINRITNGELSSAISQEISLKDELINHINNLIDLNDDFFKDVSFYAYDYQKQRPLNIKRVREMPEELKKYNYQIKSSLSELGNLWDTVDESCDFNEEEETLLSNIKARVVKIKEIWLSFLNQDLEEHVYWVEVSNYGKKEDSRKYFSSIHLSPISVAPTLHKNLFERLDSTILTSATLGTDNLQYMASRLGVGRYVGAMYHSPFDYEKQSRLYVPKNALDPRSPNYNNYTYQEIKELIKHSKGRTLVLFTSYYMLNNTANEIGDYIEKELGYKLLKQGDMQRTPLIDAFRKDNDSVLFATSSYWEGIDVQGEALSSVIITRLPFEVPDQPVVEARMEQLQRFGRNPFMDYQVPMAIMKFKQGFGRLIRSTQDKGVVTILDNRIVKMHYGKKFLSSLPPLPQINDMGQVKDFFERN